MMYTTSRELETAIGDIRNTLQSTGWVFRWFRIVGGVVNHVYLKVFFKLKRYYSGLPQSQEKSVETKKNDKSQEKSENLI